MSGERLELHVPYEPGVCLQGRSSTISFEAPVTLRDGDLLTIDRTVYVCSNITTINVTITPARWWRRLWWWWLRRKTVWTGWRIHA